MAGIKIPFLAEMRDFLRGLRDGSEGVDDLADSLDDLAREGAKDADKLGDALTDTGQAGTAAADRIEHSFRDALDAVTDDSKRAGNAIGDDIDRGARKAAASTDELKQSARQNAQETAASFDGSAQSIADGFQGAAAEAFAGFGPAGAVAGLAAAAGIGIVGTQLGKAKEEAQETAQEVADIAGELIDLGSSRRGPQEVNDALKELATSAEDGTVKLDKIAKTASDAGIDYKRFARGVAGDSTAAADSFAEVQAALDAYTAQQDDLTARYGYYSQQSTAFRDSVGDQRQALFDARDELLKTDKTLDQASQTAAEYTAATKGTTEATEAQTAATQAAEAAQSALGDALASFVDPLETYTTLLQTKQDAEQAAAQTTADKTEDQTDSWQDYATAVTVSVDEYLAQLQRQVEAQEGWAANMKTLAARGVDEGVLAKLAELGPEGAGLVAQFATGTDAQLATLADLFRRNTAAATAAVADEITKAQGPTANALDRFTASLPAVRLGVDASALQQSVDAAARTIVPPTITAPFRAGMAIK